LMLAGLQKFAKVMVGAGWRLVIAAPQRESCFYVVIFVCGRLGFLCVALSKSSVEGPNRAFGSLFFSPAKSLSALLHWARPELVFRR
jgi:hypothetical protein